MLFFPISGVRMLGFVTLLYDKSKNMFTFLNTNFCVIRTIVLTIALLLFFKFQIKGFRVKYITELFFPLELLGEKKIWIKVIWWENQVTLLGSEISPKLAIMTCVHSHQNSNVVLSIPKYQKCFFSVIVCNYRRLQRADREDFNVMTPSCFSHLHS